MSNLARFCDIADGWRARRNINESCARDWLHLSEEFDGLETKLVSYGRMLNSFIQTYAEKNKPAQKIHPHNNSTTTQHNHNITTAGAVILIVLRRKD